MIENFNKSLDFFLQAALASMFEVGKTVEKNRAAVLPGNATKYYLDKGINELNKKLTASEGKGITPTDKKIKKKYFKSKQILRKLRNFIERNY